MNKHEFEITAALNNHDDLTGYGISHFIEVNFHHLIGFGTLYLHLDKLVENHKVIRTEQHDKVFTYRLNREAFKEVVK